MRLATERKYGNRHTEIDNIVSEIRLTWSFPWPKGVTTNHLYVGMGKGRHLSAAARAWRDEAITIIRQWAITEGVPLQLSDGPWSFVLYAWPPDRRKRDADNLLKLTADAVADAFGVDDQVFVEHHAYRFAPTKSPALGVYLLPACDVPMTPTPSWVASERTHVQNIVHASAGAQNRIVRAVEG